jgi:Arc/MetJ-type ribon-helix-helix transcriptional regulator
MPEMELKIKVNEFLARRVKEIVKSGVFTDEEEFLKDAVKEMVRKYEVRELNIRIDEFAGEMAKKHPKSLSEMVMAVRAEEDETL